MFNERHTKLSLQISCCEKRKKFLFSCGSAECEKTHIDRLSLGMWSTVLVSTVARLSHTRCDFCFLCAPIIEVNRSLCKNYCRKVDDEVHKAREARREAKWKIER